jgi:glycosyltransferase involved in cell wall biosynthesis
VVLLKGYPRLSETFIAQELLGLERRGIRLVLVSLRRPTDASRHPIHAEIQAPVHYLPEYLSEAPLTVLQALWRARRLNGFSRALRAFARDLWRDRTPNRVRRFGQAVVTATLLPADTSLLYAHFLHTPASVARYTALLTGLAWSASAHARDIWTTPDWDLKEKLAEASWCVTCTGAGAARLASLAPPGRVDLVYHGLDLDRFGINPMPPSDRSGSDPNAPVRLLSVGRLVEKKGYDDLIAALSTLPRDRAWVLDHIGGGPLKGALQAAADAGGVADRIRWHGAQPQAAVLAAYRAADAFVLPSRIASDGDRDGLPNVLMEAQSQGLACVSTAVSAIPELITSEVNGLLVAPGDRGALSAALTRVISDPDLRTRLGAAGRAMLVERFSMDAGLDRLAAKLAS